MESAEVVGSRSFTEAKLEGLLSNLTSLLFFSGREEAPLEQRGLHEARGGVSDHYQAILQWH